MTGADIAVQRGSGVDLEYLVLPGRTDPSAIVHLDGIGGQKPVIWNSARLSSLDGALDAIALNTVEAVVLLGSAHSFGVGADLDTFLAAEPPSDADEPNDADRLISDGWRVFRRLADLPIPSIALVSGFALGGGLELALFCDWRIARSDTRAIGMPEVRLGLVPGWGGIYRLARLAGPRVAYNLAVRDSRRGRNLSAAEASREGVVDEVIDVDEWQTAWPVAAAAFVAGFALARRHQTVDADRYRSELDEVRASFEHSRPTVSAAPQSALALISAAWYQSPAEAETTTSRAFAGLLRSEPGRASLYSYRLSRSSDKHAAGAGAGAAVEGRTIERAAVIGAGLMASQLATLLVQFGRLPVVLTDLDQERADRGAERVRTSLLRAAERGELSQSDAARLGGLVTASGTLDAIADADFVIEAIFENMAAKKQALVQAEAHLSPHALLATNTSSLSVSEMADGLRHPERAVGFHIFNPVDVVPLVEIIRGRQTDEVTIATALGLARNLRRQTVVAADSPGFVVNRVLARLYDVVMAGIDAGGDPLVIDHSIDDLGLPMTPLRLLDFVGPAVELHINESMHKAFPDRFRRLHWLARIVEAGQRAVLQADQTLTARASSLLPPRQSGMSDDELAELTRTGILDALTDEIERMLAEGVVESAADVDKAMILGANFPWALGGLTPYLEHRKKEL